MKKILFSLIALYALVSCSDRASLSSPDGSLSVRIYTTETGDSLRFDLFKDGTPLLEGGSLGLKTNFREWSDGLKIAAAGKPVADSESYRMKTGKRLDCHNDFMVCNYRIENAEGERLLIDFKLANDGFAFRYNLPETLEGETVTEEYSSYRIPDGTRRWIQTYERDGYEAFYPLTTNGKARGKWRPANEWGYPALAESADSLFVLLTEACISRSQCGSYLDNSAEEQRYRVTLADVMETGDSGTWVSPWRVVMAGSLADIVESTLVTDLSPASRIADTSWIKPGLSAWVYWAHNNGSSDYETVISYIDLAAEMGWPYDLIDASWDKMSGGGDIEDALEYASAKGVKPIVWYNSSTNWIDGAPTPHYRLNRREDRLREFEWLRGMGVAGIKVDFFRGDKVEDMDYYIDILEDAAAYNLIVNFHGATLPRGWQRTWPNLVSIEGVYGAEWYNNTPVLTNAAARHNATLPFTRNVVGSMDYTPGTFSDSQHPHITSDCHELALTVLFESGIQHMPDRPETYASLDEDVREILSGLPAAWDDTRLLAGYPGEYCVLARRSGKDWYIAGINGSDESRTVEFSLERLGNLEGYIGNRYADTKSGKGFVKSEFTPDTKFQKLELGPRSGFLMLLIKK